MAAESIKLAVVGLGAAGRRHAETAARDLRNAQLAALVDADQAVARRFGEELGAPSRGYHDALEANEIDGIVLATPTPLHPEMIEQAAAAGKHVFCEKPIGLDLVRSAEAVARAAAADVILQVGFVRRFDPDWRNAHERIEAGELGEIYYLRAGQRDKIVYPDVTYIEQVGNLFQDVMVHEFDVARWLVGDIEEVNAIGTSPTQPELTAVGDAQVVSVALRFTNGAIGSLDAAMLASHGYDCYTEVLGQDAAMRIGYGTRVADVVTIADEISQQRFPRDFRKRFRAGFVGELQHFVDCIATETQPMVGGDDALAASVAAEAASLSFKLGRPVRLSEITAAARALGA